MKKILSIVLAIVIALSCCTGLLTYAAQDDTYDHLPQVYIEGFESKRVYYKGDENKTSLLYPIDSGRMSAATALLPAGAFLYINANANTAPIPMMQTATAQNGFLLPVFGI